MADAIFCALVVFVIIWLADVMEGDKDLIPEWVQYLQKPKPDCKRCKHFGLWEISSDCVITVCTVDTNGACREAPTPHPGSRRCKFEAK